VNNSAEIVQLPAIIMLGSFSRAHGRLAATSVFGLREPTLSSNQFLSDHIWPCMTALASVKTRRPNWEHKISVVVGTGSRAAPFFGVHLDP
jgi:hypothetical protein